MSLASKDTEDNPGDLKNEQKKEAKIIVCATKGEDISKEDPSKKKQEENKVIYNKHVKIKNKL